MQAASTRRSCSPISRYLRGCQPQVRRSIDDYKQIAGMDISKNPGLTATLYTFGYPASAALAAKNRASGETAWLEENYYDG